MKELGKMEDAEEQVFLEELDTLQTNEEHARNLAILREQKERRIRYHFCEHSCWTLEKMSHFLPRM